MTFFMDFCKNGSISSFAIPRFSKIVTNIGGICSAFAVASISARLSFSFLYCQIFSLIFFVQSQTGRWHRVFCGRINYQPAVNSYFLLLYHFFVENSRVFRFFLIYLKSWDWSFCIKVYKDCQKVVNVDFLSKNRLHKPNIGLQNQIKIALIIVLERQTSILLWNYCDFLNFSDIMSLRFC